MKKRIFTFLFVLLLGYAPNVFCHCQVPCGIYDDQARIDAMAEHITTIEESMKQIIKLSNAANKNYNQIVRWVMNKENHADYLQEIVSQYFLAQRIKATNERDEAYVKKVVLLHRMLVYAMQAKQTTDLEVIKKLKSFLNEFRLIYFGDKGTMKIWFE